MECESPAPGSTQNMTLLQIQPKISNLRDNDFSIPLTRLFQNLTLNHFDTDFLDRMQMNKIWREFGKQEFRK